MNKLNFYKRFKAYTLRIKDQRKQNIALLRTYLKKQRVTIVQNTRRRMIQGTLWIGLLSVSYYFAHKIYSQKLQVQQMQKKLTRLYPLIVSKIQTEGKEEVYYAVPQYDDQLANIIEMCWKYHYKVIVNSDLMEPQMKNQNIRKFLTEIPQAIKGKCIIINLQKLKKVNIDQINFTMKVESGVTCKQLNKNLIKLGYQPIFPQQIASNLSETVYNAVVNNYPTNNGPISHWIANIDLISPQGQYFRSSNQNNQYGSTPNLNTIFIGTGGIFGLPFRTNFRLVSKLPDSEVNERFQIKTDDLNQKIISARKLKQYLETPISKTLDYQIKNTQKDSIEIVIKAYKGYQNVLQSVNSYFQKFIPDIKIKKFEKNGKVEQKLKLDYNIFFNVNQRAFQKFLVLREKKKQTSNQLNFYLSSNLLKVDCKNENQMIGLISQLCSENAVVVWCKDHKFMKDIKKITDESQVGSQLMKIMVQIRQGIDHKKIYYTHNRYEEYFAKGAFRKLTEVFW